MKGISFFKDAEYERRMHEEVEPWKRSQVRMNRYHTNDGTRNTCYYALQEKPRGSVVIVHGFTEYSGRYMEMMYYYFEAGYSVYFLEQRGHGRSGRKVRSVSHVHVGSFNEYVGDLKYLMDHVVNRLEPETRKLLFCHSMGGAVGALFLEQYPEYFTAAVLSSPMIAIHYGDTPKFLLKAYSDISYILGRMGRPLPGNHDFTGEDDFENSCSLSPARYARDMEERRTHRAYQTSTGTLGWARAAMKASDRLLADAGRIAVPLLICQAGLETLVDNGAQERFASLVDGAELIRFPAAKHEIFNGDDETIETYYETVIRFFDEMAGE